MAAVPSIGRASGVEGALAPEADATRALYEQYANQVFRYCLHQLGSREEAEDAVQSTFLNAFRGIKRGVVPELEAAWREAEELQLAVPLALEALLIRLRHELAGPQVLAR